MTIEMSNTPNEKVLTQTKTRNDANNHFKTNKEVYKKYSKIIII